MIDDEKQSDTYTSPLWLPRWLSHYYGKPIICDAASSDHNKIVPLNYTRERSGLDNAWPADLHGMTYVNPPYSKQAAWLKRGIDQHRSGAASVLVVSSFLSDRYWIDLDYHAAEILFFCGRICFHHADGRLAISNRHGTIVVHFDGRPREANKRAEKTFVSTVECIRDEARLDPAMAQYLRIKEARKFFEPAKEDRQCA